MAKKNKFNGTQIKIATGYDGNLRTPTSITVTVPTAPVFNMTGHGLQSGDVIYLSGVDYSSASGFFPVKRNSDGAFVVVGANFSFLSSADLSKVRYQKVIMSGMCDARNIKLTSFSTSSDDVTTNCDEVKVEESIVEAGESSMEINWKLDSRLHQQIENMGEAQAPTYIQFKPLNVNILRGFKATVSSFEYSGEVNGYYSASVGFKHQSLKHDIELN